MKYTKEYYKNLKLPGNFRWLYFDNGIHHFYDGKFHVRIFDEDVYENSQDMIWMLETKTSAD